MWWWECIPFWWTTDSIVSRLVIVDCVWCDVMCVMSILYGQHNLCNNRFGKCYAHSTQTPSNMLWEVYRISTFCFNLKMNCVPCHPPTPLGQLWRKQVVCLFAKMFVANKSQINKHIYMQYREIYIYIIYDWWR